MPTDPACAVPAGVRRPARAGPVRRPARAGPSYARGVIVVVDLANVLGSRPDGWWQDRAAAAGRLLDRLARLPGTEVAGPRGDVVAIDRLITVVEGAARAIPAPAGSGAVEVVRAVRDGDSAMVAPVDDLVGAVGVLVVTADRGLRQRLPTSVPIAGPNWLNKLIDR